MSKIRLVATYVVITIALFYVAHLAFNKMEVLKQSETEKVADVTSGGPWKVVWVLETHHTASGEIRPFALEVENGAGEKLRWHIEYWHDVPTVKVGDIVDFRVREDQPEHDISRRLELISSARPN